MPNISAAVFIAYFKKSVLSSSLMPSKNPFKPCSLPVRDSERRNVLDEFLGSDQSGAFSDHVANDIEYFAVRDSPYAFVTLLHFVYPGPKHHLVDQQIGAEVIVGRKLVYSASESRRIGALRSHGWRLAGCGAISQKQRESMSCQKARRR